MPLVTTSILESNESTLKPYSKRDGRHNIFELLLGVRERLFASLLRLNWIPRFHMVIGNRAVGPSAVSGYRSHQRGILSGRCLWSHCRDLCLSPDCSRLSQSQNDLSERLRGKKQKRRARASKPQKSPRGDKPPLTPRARLTRFAQSSIPILRLMPPDL
jgi:hypothetical protein